MSQITSEQILEDAFQIRDLPASKPRLNIQDLEELRLFQLTKRRDYEQQLNKNRLNFGQWVRYARWEVDHNHDFARARSIYERALAVNVQHVPFWIHYIRMELAHKNINHARNILDRAVTTLPRVDKLWYTYVQTEEFVGNYQGVRSVFERWISWRPGASVWDSYVSFEVRYDEFDRARNIFQRQLEAASAPGSNLQSAGAIWRKWIAFEQETQNQTQAVRMVFELAVNMLVSTDDPDLAPIVRDWTAWETSVHEYERARAIYNLLLESSEFAKSLSQDQRSELHKNYANFERLYGDKSTIEDTIVAKRKLRYLEDIKNDPCDYDSWWAYLNLVASNSDEFEKAVAHPPSETSKSILWKRYVFLWIRWALWEEFHNHNVAGARNVWTRCLKQIPHSKFSFGKIWIHAAEFELRNVGLHEARKLLGQAIGRTSKLQKNKIFKYYVALEKKLGEWERCRKIYLKWLQTTTSASVLLEVVEFEQSLEETARVESLFEMGVSFEPLLSPELWQRYIDFYKDEMRYEDARKVYERLLSTEDSVHNWVSFALFESSILSDRQMDQLAESNDDNIEFDITDDHRDRTRNMFTRALNHYKTLDNSEARIAVLQEWKNYEQANGDTASVESVEAKMPSVVKRRRTVDGEEQEYMDFVFPNDKVGISKFLANAKKWKTNI